MSELQSLETFIFRIPGPPAACRNRSSAIDIAINPGKMQGMSTQTIYLEGRSYVVVPSEEYHRLLALSKAADLPPPPEPDAKGNYPAVEYACAAIARG